MKAIGAIITDTSNEKARSMAWTETGRQMYQWGARRFYWRWRECYSDCSPSSSSSSSELSPSSAFLRFAGRFLDDSSSLSLSSPATTWTSIPSGRVVAWLSSLSESMKPGLNSWEPTAFAFFRPSFSKCHPRPEFLGGWTVPHPGHALPCGPHRWIS